MTPAGWLALSDERDLQLRRLLAAERAAYQRGVEDGDRQGYERAYADQDAAWRTLSRWVARRANDPTHAELERRRYGPGGREHFGDPRPGDRRPRQEARR